MIPLLPCFAFTKDTENNLLYMACSIQKTIKLEFNYDKKAVWDRVKHQSISLLVNDESEIDFEMIERLISAIKKRTLSFENISVVKC